jgi:hypothetical protein
MPDRQALFSAFITSNFCGGKIQTIVLNGNEATYYQN